MDAERGVICSSNFTSKTLSPEEKVGCYKINAYICGSVYLSMAM